MCRIRQGFAFYSKIFHLPLGNNNNNMHTGFMKNEIGVYEFARLTGRDVTSLYKLIYSGKLIAKKRGSGKRQVWHIPKDQIEAFSLGSARKTPRSDS
jgi:hypothetical protein